MGPVGLSVALWGGEVPRPDEMIPEMESQSGQALEEHCPFPIYLFNTYLLGTYHRAWHYMPGLERKDPVSLIKRDM